MKEVTKKSYYLEKETAFEMARLSAVMEISQSEFAQNAMDYYITFLKATLPTTNVRVAKYL